MLFVGKEDLESRLATHFQNTIFDVYEQKLKSYRVVCTIMCTGRIKRIMLIYVSAGTIQNKRFFHLSWEDVSNHSPDDGTKTLISYPATQASSELYVTGVLEEPNIS